MMVAEFGLRAMSCVLGVTLVLSAPWRRRRLATDGATVNDGVNWEQLENRDS